jgi:outer membrane scaffolding protein for murein synthesis (MipA/OmpV family)
MKCSTCSGTSSADCRRRRHAARGAFARVLALALAAPLAALAQSREDYVLLGAGVRSRPAYDGSASQRVDAVPVVRYYGRPWFVRTTQGIFEGGARTALAPGLNAGAQLAYEAGRLQNESDFLRDRGVPDINPGPSYGLHVEWDGKLGPAPFTLLARGRQHMDSDRGARADLRFTLGIYGDERVLAGLFIQGTWANAKSSRAFYGVTPQESAATGLPVFEPEGGPLFATAGLLWSVTIAREWLLVGNLEGRRLEGDAARSPLTERASNVYVGLGVAYRLR